MNKLLLALLFTLLLPAVASAQQLVDTELPAAGVLGDALANPTVTSLGAHALVFDGTVWRRLTVGVAGTASTQVLTIQGIAAMTPIKSQITDGAGTAYTLSTDFADGSVYAAASAGPLFMTVRKDTAAAFTGVIDGDVSPLQVNATGQLRVTDDVGGTPLAVVTAATSTNATSVKTTAGRLLGIYLVNTTGTLQYIRFYNLAAAPTCSSAVGHVFAMPIPASTSGAGFSMAFPDGGLAFSTGIAYCITAGPASTDVSTTIVGTYGVLNYK